MKRAEELGLHLDRRADEAQLGMRLLAAHQVRVLAREADRPPALGVDRLNEPLVHLARQNHLHHVDGCRVGDPLAVAELGRDREPPEKLVDHRAATVDDHRVDAHLLHQDHVAGEGLDSRRPTHRMTTELDDHRRAVVALQVGKRRAEGPGGGDPVTVHRLRSHHGPSRVGPW